RCDCIVPCCRTWVSERAPVVAVTLQVHQLRKRPRLPRDHATGLGRALGGPHHGVGNSTFCENVARVVKSESTRPHFCSRPAMRLRPELSLERNGGVESNSRPLSAPLFRFGFGTHALAVCSPVNLAFSVAGETHPARRAVPREQGVGRPLSFGVVDERGRNRRR